MQVIRDLLYMRYQPGAEPNMLKILPIIPSRISKNFDPLFLFYATSSPIIPTYSCNLIYCIGDNNVHNTHSDYYTGE